MRTASALPRCSTLLAENDPYNSAKSIAKADNVANEPIGKIEAPQRINNRLPGETDAEILNQKPQPVRNRPEEKPILRAIRVEPQPEETPVEIRRAVPVGPMDEVDEGALLKAGTPSPPGSNDE